MRAAHTERKIASEWITFCVYTIKLVINIFPSAIFVLDVYIREYCNPNSSLASLYWAQRAPNTFRHGIDRSSTARDDIKYS